MNNKFESIYCGEYVELFFLREDLYPYDYNSHKQLLIEAAFKAENNLTNSRLVSKISDNFFLVPYFAAIVSSRHFNLTLNLSSFENLRTFKKNETWLKLKSLPKTLKNLSFYDCSFNIETQSDLSIFTGFENLEILDLGIPAAPFASWTTRFSCWKGSLESLKNCKKLRFLCIGHITDITGLEYLPLDSLETVNLYGTPFDNLLFGDKTLDPNKLTTYSQFFSEKEVISAIRAYQQNFKKEKFLYQQLGEKDETITSTFFGFCEFERAFIN